MPPVRQSNGVPNFQFAHLHDASSAKDEHQICQSYMRELLDALVRSLPLPTFRLKPILSVFTS